MKTLPLSFDQYRREIRSRLFLKRQQDKDNSEARLFYDSKKLDALLLDAGYELLYSGEWSRHFDENRHLKRLENSPRTYPKGSQTQSNLVRG